MPMAPQKNQTSHTSPTPAVGAAGVLLFFCGLLLFLLAVIPASSGWRAIHDTLYMIFGPCAILAGPVIMLSAAYMAFGGFSKIKYKIIFGSLCLWFLSAWLDIIAGADKAFELVIADAPKFVGGGVFGYILARPFTSILGKTGGVIIIVVLFLLFLVLSLGLTLAQLLIGAKKGGEAAVKATKTVVEKISPQKERDRKQTNFDLPAPGDMIVPDIEDGRIPAPLEENPPPASPGDIFSPLAVPRFQDVYSSNPQQPEPTGLTNVKPPFALLKLPKVKSNVDASKELQLNSQKLTDTLKSFGVDAAVINISRGPTVTRYEVQPRVGVKISKITGLSDDIALNLAAAGVRIEAPIPGKPAVGIEIPNKINEAVTLRELVSSEEFQNAKSPLTVSLGKDISGHLVLCDLAKLPHILISGTTGSGKSVCVNSIIVSLLYKSTAEEIQLIMVDPKKVELSNYNGLPHLASPVVSDPRKAAGALNWAVQEMLRRYKLFAEAGTRDIDSYNDKIRKAPHGYRIQKDGEQIELKPLSKFVIIIDELADLMMAAPSEVETSICRLAQMARAAGMHLVIATQRPSVDVITGLIKANIPSRIALKVSSQVDSRTMIDGAGAEKLLGNGDMLYFPVGAPKPKRVQGCYVSDSEIESVIRHIIKHSIPPVDADTVEIEREIERLAPVDKGAVGTSDADGEMDARISEAIECILEAGEASASLLQRRLKLGYARAGRIIDQLEQRGYIGPSTGSSKPREVRITRERFLEMEQARAAARAEGLY